MVQVKKAWTSPVVHMLSIKTGTTNNSKGNSGGKGKGKGGYGS